MNPDGNIVAPNYHAQSSCVRNVDAGLSGVVSSRGVFTDWAGADRLLVCGGRREVIYFLIMASVLARSPVTLVYCFLMWVYVISMFI